MPRFYLLTDSAEAVARLLPAGVRLVQLRMKNADPAVLRVQIRRAQQCCARYSAQLILNDYWQLALELGVDFVHLGQEDMGHADFPALRHAHIRFGLSTHTEAELNRALALDPAYVALGPVYPTLLKKMRYPPQGLARVAQWKALAGKTPLVAIGGLTPERAPAVLAAGADSVAVMSDIRLAADPVERCRTWLRVTGERKSHEPLW